MSAAADLIENQQREIEALRQANEGLRFNLAALHDSGGHPDPVGKKGALSECPVCGGPCNWEPETDGSTCRVCGYRSGEARKEASNEGLRFNLATQRNGKRAVEDASPYTETTEKPDVGGGVPDAPNGDEICRAALEAFGAEAQITMVFEEMAELQDVLCKFLRGRVDDDTRTHIAEEIADVEIMLQQMKMLFDCTGQVDGFRWYKLERLAGRIKEVEKHEHE